MLREWRGWGLERLDGLQQGREPRHRLPNVGALCEGLFEAVHAVGTIHDPTEGLLPPQRPTGGKAAVEHGPCGRELTRMVPALATATIGGAATLRAETIECIRRRRSF